MGKWSGAKLSKMMIKEKLQIEREKRKSIKRWLSFRVLRDIDRNYLKQKENPKAYCTESSQVMMDGCIMKIIN